MFKSKEHKKKIEELVRQGKFPEKTYQKWLSLWNPNAPLPERVTPKKTLVLPRKGVWPKTGRKTRKPL